MATVNIRPFRNYSEADVINLYRLSGDALPYVKGNFVKIVTAGFVANANPVDTFADVGLHYQNTVSKRWGVPQAVSTAGTGDNVLGMTLNDVAEIDENGESLLFNPHKQAETQTILSGQAVPILTRGFVMYSGVNGTPTAGGKAYVSGGTVTANTHTGNVQVGNFLGEKDSNGWVLLKINL